jgi:hypothetical protein
MMSGNAITFDDRDTMFDRYLIFKDPDSYEVIGITDDAPPEIVKAWESYCADNNA